MVVTSEALSSFKRTVKLVDLSKFLKCFKTFVYFRTVIVYVNFYLLFAHCRPNCTVIASRLTKAPIVFV